MVYIWWQKEGDFNEPFISSELKVAQNNNETIYSDRCKAAVVFSQRNDYVLET